MLLKQEEWVAVGEEMNEDDEFEMVHRDEAEFDEMDGVKDRPPPASKIRRRGCEEDVCVSSLKVLGISSHTSEDRVRDMD